MNIPKTSLFENQQPDKPGDPVECLGMTFDSEETRRTYFLERLKEKLPALRQRPDFPLGPNGGPAADEDILRLSDPPYYTACPNPFLEDFVKQYGRPYDPNETYHREPFAVDTSEGKTDPLYKAHGYHTKVPHLAIVPSILHYTKPGDLVLDGFCGSGMTGIAAQWCGTAPFEYRRTIEERWKSEGREKPEWGSRRVILGDLAPAATFIAANYNVPFDVDAFAQAAWELLDEVEQEIGWMYETLHVEPASSRLIKETGFRSFSDAASVEPTSVEPASSRLENIQDAEPTAKGITEFTIRQDNLPHWQCPGATYFVTFTTYNRRILSPAGRTIVLDALRYWDGERIRLIAAVVMPDHVHAVIQPLPKGEPVEPATPYWDLSEVMHSIKSYSANEINKIEHGQPASPRPPVWQAETYDRIIRDEREYAYVLQYVAFNPVLARLVEKPEDYQWFEMGEGIKKAGWKPAPQLGRINYTVWSEVFSCPECTCEVVFVEEALDQESKRVREEFPCPACNAKGTKDTLQRSFETLVDPDSGNPWKRVRFRPVLINYSIGKQNREKKPDETDLATLGRIAGLPMPSEVPTNAFPTDQMYHGSRIEPKGFSHVHHMFLPRAAQALAAMWRRACANKYLRVRNMLLFFAEQAITGMSVLARYAPTHFSQVNQYLTGVYYIGSQIVDVSPWYILDGKLKRLKKAFSQMHSQTGLAVVTTGDCARIPIPDNSIDYVFTDPPFGENIYYADLNYLVESWHRVLTPTEPEAIVDQAKQKGMLEYQHLMQRCFEEYRRVLKPGRWMTMVFHNSRNAVWNAIQEAMLAAGFVVADVRTLDKKQGSYRQVTSTAVKQDLVISAYKPNHGLEERFKLEAGTEEGMWDFVRTHLRQLPVFVSKEGQAEVVAERQNYLLFDRMVAFHVQRGVTVPLSAGDFYEGLAQRLPERDGMYFLPEQVAEYDRKRMTVKDVAQLELFVKDEESAIQWLKATLTRKPQTFQEIHPQFMKELGGWEKHEKRLELSELLEQNFLRYEGKGEVPSQIHGYLSSNFKELRGLPKDNSQLRNKAKDRWYVPDPRKAGDLEKLRERALLREFEEYRETKQKKLKVFRLEAVRAGFKKAWQERDYPTIIAIARKIPENILQEDSKLLMWYDQAVTRSGE